MTDESLDQLGGSISHQNLILAEREVSGSQKGIYIHSGRILADQYIKIGSDFIQHLFGWIVAVYQITEIQHAGIAPVASEPAAD